MRVGTTVGQILVRRGVEFRAERIHDPVEKLRYLRRSMGASGRPTWQRRERNWTRGPGLKWVLLAVLLMVPIPTVSDVPWFPNQVPLLTSLPGPGPAPPVPHVWLVERNKDYDLYSNGLRVDKRFTVANEKRSYPVYDRKTLKLVEWRKGPVGILYHTTESHQAPFDANHNRRLRLVGKWLLQYVQQIRSYHFVIDRFGEVHSVVRESDSGNHAGYSIWADSRFVYVNLNPSFLGVAFETESGNGKSGAQITPAQVHAGRVLTEMLRSKYHIPARTCVTHAQVSVFPLSMKFGNHVDWTAKLPFGEFGLPNNYDLPVAALGVFGFRYNLKLLKSTGSELWKGVALGEDEFRRAAAGDGVPLALYKKTRKQRYREILEVIEEAIASQENQS